MYQYVGYILVGIPVAILFVMSACYCGRIQAQKFVPAHKPRYGKKKKLRD